MASYATLRNRMPSLRRIGLWATWWWAVSGAYIVVLGWESHKDDIFVEQGSSFANWMSAITHTFATSAFLQVSLVIIVSAWIVGGFLWFRELKRYNVKYTTALKDLFLTIRK